MLSLFFCSDPTPPSGGDSCLSLINGWHLVRQETGDTVVTDRGGGLGRVEEGGGVAWAWPLSQDGEKCKRQRGIKERSKSERGRGRRDGGLLGSRGRTEEEGVKMRSNRDLDSKTPRHNRQGFTPREPPTPHSLHHSSSVKTITESGEERGGPVQGWTHLLPPCTVFGLSV